MESQTTTHPTRRALCDAHVRSTRHRSMWQVAIASAGLALSGLSGCTTWHVPNILHLGKDKDPGKVVPHRIVPMWTDTVMYQPGKPGVRGFGARIYFYEEEAKTPVRVDGTLTVFAFDANKVSRMPLPEKKFVFTAEQLAQHHSKTSIGDSYSIWIPWDEVGGPTRQLSLVTRFEGREVGSVVSEPVRKVLPGLSDDEQLAGKSKDSAGSAMPVSYEQTEQAAGDLGAGDGNKDSLPSITIDVPPSFSRKLQTKAASGGTPPSVSSLTGATLGGSRGLSFTQENATANVAAESESESAAGSLSYHQRLATHFSQRKSQVRSRQESRPSAAPPRRQPHHATWLPGLPPTPRSSATDDSSAE